MLELDDVVELSLWGLELVVEEGASAGSEPASRVDSVRRAAAPLTAAAGVLGRLPLLASEAGTAGASRVAHRRRAADAKLAKKA